MLPVSLLTDCRYPHRQATALYDFEPQPDTSEIQLRAGELLTITRTDVGEGWWEGVNERQQCGLFPEAYCEVSHRHGPPTLGRDFVRRGCHKIDGRRPSAYVNLKCA